MRISAIIPVYNSTNYLRKCLAALAPAVGPDFEVIVVDDASTDDIAAIVAGGPVRLLRLSRNSGPATARNHAARHATGDVLFFVDADVVVRPDTLSRIRATLTADPTLAAVFGSYDDQPAAPGLVSQYRNLLHHYVHQTGNSEAFTFWSGCGAIRRVVFEQLDGFDERRFARGLQDVELGYRLRDAGHRVLLDKQLLCTHLKQWTLSSMVETDTVKRAIPWTYLILDRRMAPSDLNIKADQRLSIVLVAVAGLSLALSAAWPKALVATALSLVGVGFLNRRLYRFFLDKRGLRFAVGAFFLHLLYFVCSGVGFAYASIVYRLAGLPMGAAGSEVDRLPRSRS
jgi:hypothetical protein